jgi:hypothetical protein
MTFFSDSGVSLVAEEGSRCTQARGAVEDRGVQASLDDVHRGEINVPASKPMLNMGGGDSELAECCKCGWKDAVWRK